MLTELITDEELLWNAIAHRDSSLDGKFLFGVMTTGVYCRPSCGCRLPLRKNVRFFEDVESAEQAGLRPCKRCRPREALLIQQLAQYLREHSEHAITLEEMAEHTGLSSFHLQRRFKAVMGLTPRQFVEACRVERFKGQLRADSSVTDAIYEAGFGSPSRIYEKVDTHLGMTPAQYRAGGKEITISYASVESALGRMMIGATDRGICFIQFANSDEELLEMLRLEYPSAKLLPMAAESEPSFHSWMDNLHRHLAGDARELDLPLDLLATTFQMKVWRYLQLIPYGSVKSYAEVAADLGQPTATRAVARACATNRVALLIPCHRVIRGSGELAGYRWGLERKRTLLDREQRTLGAEG